MDPIEIPEDLTALSVDDLVALAASLKEAGTALLAETPTAEQIAQATTYLSARKAALAEARSQKEAAASQAEAAAALLNEFAEEEDADEADADAGDEGDADDDKDEDADKDDADAEKDKVEAGSKKVVASLKGKVKRPPARTPSPVSITAAADVPDFSTGQALSDMGEVGQALVSRMKGFGTPSGDGSTENLQHYGVAKFRMDFEENLKIKQHGDDMEVLNYAAKESRLPGKSLTAAGGWCAPSETLYDLCTTETLDGILSVPEVDVTRGGIKYTSGPDFGTIYSNVGFLQTEAQAISGTTKACYEVTCPSFTDVRLDAIGLCIKAPILTNAAYPELVNRVLSGSMIAHAHKVNASVISRMDTLAGTARTATDFGASTLSTFAALTLVIDGLRQKWRMSLTESVEVVLPYWVKGVLREDMANRGNRPLQAVTDAEINAEFAARHAVPSFVYGYQELADVTAMVYPNTFNILVYPAGTFVKGTSDVITLNAVYDAASLATNVYTALFFEQGLLVARMCNEAIKVTIPTCESGKTGIAGTLPCNRVTP